MFMQHLHCFYFRSLFSMTLSLFSVSGRDFTAYDKQPLALSKWLVVYSFINQPSLASQQKFE